MTDLDAQHRMIRTVSPDFYGKRGCAVYIF
jgi:hypothetical protein